MLKTEDRITREELIELAVRYGLALREQGCGGFYELHSPRHMDEHARGLAYQVAAPRPKSLEHHIADYAADPDGSPVDLAERTRARLAKDFPPAVVASPDSPPELTLGIVWGVGERGVRPDMICAYGPRKADGDAERLGFIHVRHFASLGQFRKARAVPVNYYRRSNETVWALFDPAVTLIRGCGAANRCDGLA